MNLLGNLGKIYQISNMFAPIIKKLAENNKAFIERSLPSEGSILVNKGDIVRPFDRLGECLFSQESIMFSENFRPVKDDSSTLNFAKDSIVGRVGKNKIKAPYNGMLAQKEDGTYIFRALETKYTLLSGVWGSVAQVVKGQSVLLKANTKDLLLSACTKVSSGGELVVFPNPVEILEKYYLEDFSKNNKGKVIYIGHFADEEIVERAYEMGVSAIIAGSAHKSTFNFAKSKNLGFGIITGFGKHYTPEPIFNLLSIIAYRYVFFQGERNILRIPDSGEEETSVNKGCRPIKKVQENMDIQVFQHPYFGKIGKVDTISESSILVKFEEDKAPVEILLPNFFILE